MSVVLTAAVLLVSPPFASLEIVLRYLYFTPSMLVVARSFLLLSAFDKLYSVWMRGWASLDRHIVYTVL